MTANVGLLLQTLTAIKRMAGHVPDAHPTTTGYQPDGESGRGYDAGPNAKR
ncbi:MAG TPA: hypothetical protein VGS27_01910 [Candidatus Sulfotelmatobacter sp.]|nr:hypothetical protein [Candidatus Sulfotelmatobacter sp.]